MTIAKLSPDCIMCKERLAESDMRRYLDLCEKHGRNPLAAPKGGILCAVCLIQAIEELALDECESSQ